LVNAAGIASRVSDREAVDLENPASVMNGMVCSSIVPRPTPEKPKAITIM
jgi:hypothetical protein